jgi:hypothetical protein
MLNSKDEEGTITLSSAVSISYPRRPVLLNMAVRISKVADLMKYKF